MNITRYTSEGKKVVTVKGYEAASSSGKFIISLIILLAIVGGLLAWDKITVKADSIPTSELAYQVMESLCYDSLLGSVSIGSVCNEGEDTRKVNREDDTAISQVVNEAVTQIENEVIEDVVYTDDSEDTSTDNNDDTLKGNNGNHYGDTKQGDNNPNDVNNKHNGDDNIHDNTPDYHAD